jgi:hypothetical protein
MDNPIVTGQFHLLWLALAAVGCWLPVPARADTWILLVPGQAYEIAWRTAPDAHGFIARPRVDRTGFSPLDRWFQVAPGGGAVALWSAASGLAAFTSSGVELLRREGNVTAFRFSPSGDRLAFASATGIEVLALDQHEPRLLTSLAGVDWLRWTDLGLVARTRSKLYLVDDAGHPRTLAQVRPGVIFAAARERLVYFTNGSLVTLDLANGGAADVTRLADSAQVINAEISRDGASVLFATAKRVYLREDSRPVHVLADATGVRSLFFSPDGAAYLWSSGGPSDMVVRGGKSNTLPSGCRSARFSQIGGEKLVLTTMDSVSTWDPTTGKRSIVGGISSDDGVNLAGDLAGSTGTVILYYRKSSHQKETGTPRVGKVPPL